MPPFAGDIPEGLAGARVERARHAAAHVHDLDRRQRPPVHPARQLQPLQLLPALRPRRRGAAEQDRAGFGRPAARDVPRVVARVALLLVGGIVLLVDHDQTRVGDRSEDSRAGTYADPRLARPQPPPLVVARAGRHLRMKQRHRIAEPPPEAIHRLRGERDLGDEDDRASPPCQRLASRLQVDLGLARAGHAVEQEGARVLRLPLSRQGADHPLQNRPLISGQLDALPDRSDPRRFVTPAALDLAG